MKAVMDTLRLKDHSDLLADNIKTEELDEIESDIEDVEGMTSEPLEIDGLIDNKNEIKCCIPDCGYSYKEDDFIPGKILNFSCMS